MVAFPREVAVGFVVLAFQPEASGVVLCAKAKRDGSFSTTPVVVDEGAAKSLGTTTMKNDVYAFIFAQKGLMAGIGIQGSKITRIRRGP